MNLATLKNIVKHSPHGPGIYKFQNGKKQDIYIGKASSLKKRLLSYTKTADARINKMISSASGLVHTETDSDIEALILESQLIKQKRPQFNIMLRDDKQYFFVAITKEDQPRLGSRLRQVEAGFPRIYLTHQHQDNADLIGPFTDGTALKMTLKFLRNIFPYCTCTQKHHNFCLNYHIGKCLGYCCLKDIPPKVERSARKTYLANIKAIRDILSGKKSALVKELKKEMTSAGKKHDFEKAIELQIKIERLERVFYNAQVIKNSEILKSYNSGLQKLLKTKKPIIRIEGYDVSNIQGNHATGAMVTFVNGEPEKSYYRKFNIKTVRGANDTAMLREVIERRFNHPEWQFPDLILIDGGKGQVNSAVAILKDMHVSIPLVGISKDDKHMGHLLVIPDRKQPLPLAKLSDSDKNLLLAIDAEAHRFAISYYRKLHRKSVF